jgi:glycerol-3-phosphate acyltransferase PlsY
MLELLFEYVPPLALAAFLISYLIGSVPFGYVIGRVCGLGDIRKQGSGNIGATNMLRVGNRMLAFLTLFSDAGKGVLAVYLVGHYMGEAQAPVAAIAVVLGHIFPLWLGFKGGKGVATTLGALTMLYWPLGVFMCLAWLLVFVLTGISSVSAIVTMALAPTFCLFFATPKLALASCVLAMLVIAKHHANIRRLIGGEEHSFRK